MNLLCLPIKMLRAIIFDLDNTLIDFLKYKRLCSEAAIDAMIDAGLKIPKEKAVKELYRLMKTHGMEDNTIFQKLLKKLTGDIDYRKLASAINAYRKTRIGLLTPYPGTKSTLIRLKEKGLKLAIVTDAPKLKAYLRLTAMKLDDFFDVVIAKEDTGKLKPDNLPFKAAIKELKLPPQECLMVGDMPERDIKGAKALNLKTCFAKYGYEGKAEPKADYTIDSIEELADIF
ncbi:TIGR02253 family HAD-type hydrolase [Candidatus Woesearchaeota archaeon]|nr:TIGR02253 family HAD-type hydrolase [Candidatus Woesearchaeota archaeon]